MEFRRMEIYKFISLLWTLSNCLTTINAAKILGIFPVAAKSHFAYQEAIMKSLHAAGHEITIICPSGMTKSQENYTVISSSFVSLEETTQGSIRDFAALPIRKYLETGLAICEKYCEEFLKIKEVQTILKGFATSYDVIFHEYILLEECFYQLAHILNVPVILTLPIRAAPYTDWNTGNPSIPAIIPNGFSYSPKTMNFYQRLENTLYHIYLRMLFNTYVEQRLSQIQEKFHILKILERNYSLVFQNSHPSLLPRPLIPNVIEIGGIHLQASKPLPQNIQKFIDESKFGVILFTFGSMARGSFMSSEMINAFRDAFAEIPQRVIWKFEKDIEGLSSNVLISNWVPQRDILAHKNVRAFITHCGQGGVYEAIHEGVPLIMIPFYGDQLYNAATLEEMGVGIYVDILTATKEKILNSISAIVNDTSYGQKMKELSKIFNDNPMSPQQTVVYWTEYVIRHHGAPHLKTVGQSMPFYQYFLLDVAVFIFVVGALCFYAVYILLRTTLHILRKKVHSQKKKIS